MTHLESIAPVTKTLDLDCPIEHAFDVFTRRLATWWPLVTHSCFANPAARVEFESWPGGQVWEVTPTGERAPWGTITE